MNLQPLSYFEDLDIGASWETPGITVTESHITTFAGLTGDFADLHVDEAFATGMGFQGRVAHGILGLGLIDGLKNRSGIRFAVVAALNWNWRFSAPLYIGDRLHARLQIVEKRLTRRGDRGIVTLAIQGLKQDGTVVQEGRNELMVLCRPAQ
jgi:acyl dehydratase